MTPEGEAIIRYTLRNDSGAEVQLTNYGAAIVSVKMPDREGRMADVALGYKHPEGYFFDGAASGKSVGRCANRIASGRMTIEGKEYSLEVNNGPNHLHGGTKNFANRLWESRVETNRVVMSLLSEDGDQNYPGELNVEAVFDFDDDNALEITYLARTDKPTVVNLSHHPFFNLKGEGNGTILDHVMTINASHTTPVDSVLIPTGEIADVTGTPFDFRQPHAIGERIGADNEQLRNGAGYDHNWVLDRKTADGIEPAATVWEPASGRTIEVLTDQPAMQFYSGNFFDGKANGKYGKPLRYRESLALETQKYPDSPNHDNFPSTVLRPGEEYTQVCIYRFGVK